MSEVHSVMRGISAQSGSLEVQICTCMICAANWPKKLHEDLKVLRELEACQGPTDETIQSPCGTSEPSKQEYRRTENKHAQTGTSIEFIL